MTKIIIVIEDGIVQNVIGIPLENWDVIDLDYYDTDDLDTDLRLLGTSFEEITGYTPERANQLPRDDRWDLEEKAETELRRLCAP